MIESPRQEKERKRGRSSEKNHYFELRLHNIEAVGAERFQDRGIVKDAAKLTQWLINHIKPYVYAIILLLNVGGKQCA